MCLRCILVQIESEKETTAVVWWWQWLLLQDVCFCFAKQLIFAMYSLCCLRITIIITATTTTTIRTKCLYFLGSIFLFLELYDEQQQQVENNRCLKLTLLSDFLLFLLLLFWLLSQFFFSFYSTFSIIITACWLSMVLFFNPILCLDFPSLHRTSFLSSQLFAKPGLLHFPIKEHTTSTNPNVCRRKRMKRKLSIGEKRKCICTLADMFQW